MKRCPKDLNDINIRNNYIKNHIEWFLNNHEGAINEFLQDAKLKYEESQLSLF